MKVKKFTARTFSEALEMVKKELSQDAVILSTEERKGLRPQVEVTAAVDYDEELDLNVGRQAEEVRDRVSRSQRPAVTSASASRAKAEVHAKPSPDHTSLFRKPKAPRAAPFEPPAGRAVADSHVPVRQTAPAELRTPHSGLGADDGLRSELNNLRSLIEGMKNSGYGLSLPAKKRAMLNFLLERSIREEYALRLCDRTPELGDIPLMLAADIKVKRHSGTRKAVMLIGPTGVGKTTTIAKLAAQAVKAGRKAAIINLDTYRIGAAEQSRIYARILGIPLAVATNASEFQQSLATFNETRDVVFIDTTGRNPRDGAYIRDMAELCKVAAPLELHLLMSAGGDDECMIEAYRSYRNLPIDYLAFTKIDEAVRFGSLYNLLLTYQKPVAYITTGQRVPGDLEYATVNRLASLIVSKECYPC